MDPLLLRLHDLTHSLTDTTGDDGPVVDVLLPIESTSSFAVSTQAKKHKQNIMLIIIIIFLGNGS